MNKLTSIRIKQEDGTYSEDIPVQVLAENVLWRSGQSESLLDIIGQVDVDTDGSLQHQIDLLDSKKVDIANLNSYLASQISTDVTSWLNTNVDPVGSTVMVDSSLSIEGAAADAKATGELTAYTDIQSVVEAIDYSNVTLNTYNINNSGTWASSVHYQCYTLEIPDNVYKIKMKGLNADCYFAFLNAYNPSPGSNADFSNKFPNKLIITAGQEKNFYINREQGMNYLWISIYLNDNIDRTPVTNIYYTTDESLTKKGAAADAKTVKDFINQLGQYQEVITITQNLNLTNSGTTIETASEDNTIKVYGTATAVRHFGVFNDQSFVKTSSAAFEKTLEPGTYVFSINRTGYNPQASFALRATYTTFANYILILNSSKPDPITMTFTEPVMLAFVSTTNANYGTVDNPTYFYFSVKRLTAVDRTVRQKISDKVGNDVLYEYNSYNVLDFINRDATTHNGVTYTKNNDGSWTINGTATDSFSFQNLISSPNELPRYIIPGRTYTLRMHGGTVPIQIFWYQNGNSITNDKYITDSDIIVPDDIDGVIIRFFVAQGDTYNETVKYELVAISGGVGATINNNYTYNNTTEKTEQIFNNTYNLSVSPTITTDSHGWLQAIDTETTSESGKTDMAPAIIAMLNNTGYCHLGEGVFYITGNIDMPEGSKIEGCGKKTIIKLLQSVESGYCIKIQKYNTISNLHFKGNDSWISASEQGTRTGILFSANQDGKEGETTFESECCMLDNVWITNFSDSGIKCHNSSMNIRRGIYATNIYVVGCWCGINIDYYSEFNKFTSCCISACYYACINNGGNNVFSACTFHATNTGFYIDGTQPNSAHGTITGCTFCHIGSNNGTAIKMSDVSAGFIISNCQIWYCSIDLTNCQGILFDGCMFGRGISNDGTVSASITINNGNLVLFDGCMFHMDVTRPPKITITNNSKVRFNGCYGTESGNEITQ